MTAFQFPSRPEKTSLGITVIGIDPGVNNGYAIFVDGIINSFGTLQYGAELFDWLEEQSPNIFVVEEYIIQPKRYDHQMDKGIPMRAIGAIQYQANRCGAVFALSPAAIKPGAYAHMGAKYIKGKRGMHYMDAIAHAHEYMLKHRMITYTG